MVNSRRVLKHCCNTKKNHFYIDDNYPMEKLEKKMVIREKGG